MEYLIFIIKGFCIGVANIIPGVSGGTMAFILGIYENLINAIKSFNIHFLKLIFSLKVKEAFQGVSWKFLGSIILGILIATFTLAKTLSWLLENKPVFIYSSFFGLIVASALIVGKSIKKCTALMIIGIFISAFITYLLVDMVPVATPDALWFIFLSGVIAICAMILPGISGSFILLLLGKYGYILRAVNNRDFFVLGIFALGACVGIVIFARILSWLLNKWHDLIIVILTGLMIGSLRKIWPWKETLEAIIGGRGKILPLKQINITPTFNNEIILAIGFMALGFFIAFGINFYSKKEKVC